MFIFYSFLRLRVNNEEYASDPFSVSQPKTIHLKQQVTGSKARYRIHTVEVQAHQNYLLANITDYAGIAELRVENRCRELTVRVRQAGSTESWNRIESGYALPYIRFDPTVRGVRG